MLKFAVAGLMMVGMAGAAHATPPVGIPGAFVGEVGGGELRMPADLYVYTPNAEVGKITVIRNTSRSAMIWTGPGDTPTVQCVWPKEGSYKETLKNSASIQAGQGTDLVCMARFTNGGPFTDPFTAVFVAD